MRPGVHFRPDLPWAHAANRAALEALADELADEYYGIRGLEERGPTGRLLWLSADGRRR